MAASTIHQQLLTSFGSVAKEAEEEEDDHDNWKKRRKTSTSSASVSATSSTSAFSKELLWKEFFMDPTKWWDNRNSKPSPRYPDFRHRVTREPLWMDSWDTPSWVTEELTRFTFSKSQQVDAFVASLRACTRNKDLVRGTNIHHDLVQEGLLQKCSHALVIMYAKCGELAKAKELLDMHKNSDVVTWTALIDGYAREGRGQNALDCFEEMQREGIVPDAVTYICILKACGTIGAVDKGKHIHDVIAKQGLLQNNIVLGGALVAMYAKCGAVSKAQQVLDGLPSRNVISWNALIAGYAQQGHAEQALNCFEEMQREGTPPNAVTFICILKACATVGAVDKGKQIHDEIARQGLLQNNIVLGNALVDMYAKCGAVSKARQVLDGLPSLDVISWSALIAGYAQQGQAEQALNCFEEMQRKGILPNAVTFICILKACATIGAVDKGKRIHDEIARQGLLQNNVVLGGALVDMYAKCGAVSKARQVLDGLPSRDVVSWSALIAGYAQGGHAEQALGCFEEMQCEGILPDAVTFICMLTACATIGAVDKGKQIHDEVARQGLLQDNIMLGNALVDMYAKCGAVSKARQVLEGLPSRDVVSWNALIAGYAQEGHIEQAFDCFEKMQREGILPNVISWNALIAGYAQEGHAEQALNCFKEMEHGGILPDVLTCSSVLNVCSHRGLVEEGQSLFVNMITKYGLNPSLECYTCMIDLFGRAGHLKKAVMLIQDMPSSDYSVIWHTLLSACQKWADVNVGRWAFERAVKLDKSDGSAYVLMANIYATAGMGQKAKAIEDMRIRNRAWKKPGLSEWIDSSNITHAFSVGDTNHAQSKCIDAKLEEIARKMSQQQGYSPGLHRVSQNISYAAKTHLLCHHSEKLALACALINTTQGETVYITKNMRICGDCHVAMSLISKIEMRTIVVTDADFCHRFEDGKCSCNDYLCL